MSSRLLLSDLGNTQQKLFADWLRLPHLLVGHFLEQLKKEGIGNDELMIGLVTT